MAKKQKSYRMITMAEFMAEEMAIARAIRRIGAADKEAANASVEGVILKTTSGERVYVVPDRETADRVAMSDDGLLFIGSGTE